MLKSICYHAGNNQVGGRTDQGTGSTKDRGIAERDEELFGIQAATAGEITNNRDHHGYQWCVV